MPLSSTFMSSRHGSLVFLDGTATPVTLALQYDAGDFSVSGLSGAMAEVTTIQARHQHLAHMQGAPMYPTLSFTAFVTDFSGDATDGTIMDWVYRKTGSPFASNVSVSNNTDLYCFDVRFDVDTDSDGTADHTLTFEGCYVSDLSVTEGDGGTQLSMSLTVYGDGTNFVSGDITIPMPS